MWIKTGQKIYIILKSPFLLEIFVVFGEKFYLKLKLYLLTVRFNIGGNIKMEINEKSDLNKLITL